ncbi:Lrp/AsnC family transcriptional regulator [Chromobacterium sp. CV08]|uniref:Lrp/AsnC family transcriptional regulator n=1 Tax=Chromobacterium sp. CV08 TaxID=3133274 RepID=UPI003DA912F2
MPDEGARAVSRASIPRSAPGKTGPSLRRRRDRKRGPRSPALPMPRHGQGGRRLDNLACRCPDPKIGHRAIRCAKTAETSHKIILFDEILSSCKQNLIYNHASLKAEHITATVMNDFPSTLDKHDIKLLAILQRDARQTQYDLAKTVALSPSSCYRRVQRLREIGAIQAEVALVNPAALGQSLKMIIHVTLEKEQQHLKDAFRNRICEADEVLECYNITGDSDFLMIVSVASMAAFNAFTKQYLLSDANLKEFKTMVVLDTFKYTTALPVPHTAQDS